MGLDSISNVSANMVYAVNAVHLGAHQLSEELIKKLKALGIDPTTVKSETEARALIAQAEKRQNTAQVQSFEPKAPTSEVDRKKLHDDIKNFGDKVGIDVKLIKTLKDIVDRFDAVVKEYTVAASAQANKNMSVGNNKNEYAIKISTGAEISEKPEILQADFKSIKERVDKIEQEKNNMFAGQDMLAMMNRMKLGI